MKRNFVYLCALLLISSFSAETLNAQQTDKPKKKKQEKIIIQKNEGTKKMVIEVDGDKVTVNGKPVEEFEGAEIDILTEDIMPPRPPRAMAPGAFNFTTGGNKAKLGIMTKSTEEGLIIQEVSAGSAAEKAGLKVGDLLIKVENDSISSPDDLYKAIGSYNPGDKIKITYKRDKKTNTTTALLDKNKMNLGAFNRDFNFDMMPLEGMNVYMRKPKLGIQIQDTEEATGVKITDVDEDALGAKNGLKEGDIITEANGKAVKSIDDIKEELKDLKEGDMIKLQIKRDNKLQNIEIKFPKRLKKANL